MIYDPRNPLQAQQAAESVTYFLENGITFSLEEVKSRTLSQNAYLHVIIGVVAMHYGTSLEYAKEWYYKRLANKELYVVDVDDQFFGRVTVLKSSKKLSKEEMSLSIDRFKSWARDNGIFLPEPGDKELLMQARVEQGRCKYLY